MEEQIAEENVWVLKREVVTGGWRKMHNEELHDFYLPNITLIR
jgi:hypothetical protein